MQHTKESVFMFPTRLGPSRADWEVLCFFWKEGTQKLTKSRWLLDVKRLLGGAGVVAQQVKMLIVIMASNVTVHTHSSPGYSASTTPTLSWCAREDCGWPPNHSGQCHYVGDMEGVPGSCLPPGSHLGERTSGRKISDFFSFSLSLHLCHSPFQTNK